jgi:hypothetical protein
MKSKIKSTINKSLLFILEAGAILFPSKIMAQIQVKYGMPQPLYGMPVPQPTQESIVLGIMKLTVFPFIILILIFIGILMFIKKKINSDSSKPKKTGKS